MFQRISFGLVGVALLVACGSAGAPVDPPSTGNQDPLPSSNQPLVGQQTTSPGSITSTGGSDNSGNNGNGNGNGSCSTSDACQGCSITSDCNAYCECNKQLAGGLGASLDCNTICSN